jgi:DNA-binding NarL/FixJ family response regulator
VTFLVVDDHPVSRQSLAALILGNNRWRVCGEAGTLAEARAALEKAVPDIAVIDITLLGQEGLDIVRSLKVMHPEVISLVISTHDDAVCAERALTAGARGYIAKPEAASLLADAVDTVLAGRIYLAAAMRDRLLESALNRDDHGEEPG